MEDKMNLYYDTEKEKKEVSEKKSPKKKKDKIVKVRKNSVTVYRKESVAKNMDGWEIVE